MPRFARISEGQLKKTGGTTSAVEKKKAKQKENQKNVPPRLQIFSTALEHLWGILDTFWNERRLGGERQWEDNSIR